MRLVAFLPILVPAVIALAGMASILMPFREMTEITPVLEHPHPRRWLWTKLVVTFPGWPLTACPDSWALGVHMKFKAFLPSLFRGFLLPVVGGLVLTPSLAQTQKSEAVASFHCLVTQPNHQQPPRSNPPDNYPGWMAERNRGGDTLLLPADTRPEQKFFHGNGKLWTVLPPRKIYSGYFPDLYDDPALAMETDWWQMGHELLVITGKRLDAHAGPLHVRGVGSAGASRGDDGPGHFLASVILPTQGCWEITGKIYGNDDSALTFVVDVRDPK